MRLSELETCLRIYRNAIDACDELSAALRSSQDAAHKAPELRLVLERLVEAHEALERIGDGLAILPELVEEVVEAKRISEMLRKQAKAAGVKFRYDAELSKSTPLDEPKP